MHTVYVHRDWRLFVVMALQAAGMLGVWLFVSRILVPYGGAPAAFLWIAGALLLACWLDGISLGSAVAFTAVALANFGLFVLALHLWDGWGLLWAAPMLWFGHRLGAVIDERVIGGSP
jgi:hypothetical protein